jgi:hypothetical protein
MSRWNRRIRIVELTIKGRQLIGKAFASTRSTWKAVSNLHAQSLDNRLTF